MSVRSTSFTRQKLGVIPPSLQKKWPIHLLDEGFVPFPKKILRVLSALYPESDVAKELAVVMAIVDFRREGQTRNPSQDFLAYTAGLELEEFITITGKLASKGWLSDPTSVEENKNFSLQGLEETVLALAAHET